MVNTKKPDVILLDVKMPDKSGLQVAKELKNIVNIPFIGMTGCYKPKYLPLMNICRIQTCIKNPFYPLDIIYQI